jgi:hypothetical protein
MPEELIKLSGCHPGARKCPIQGPHKPHYQKEGSYYSNTCGERVWIICPGVEGPHLKITRVSYSAGSLWSLTDAVYRVEESEDATAQV